MLARVECERPPGRSIERTCTFHQVPIGSRLSTRSTLSKRRRAVALEAHPRARPRRDCARVSTPARKTCSLWTDTMQPQSAAIGNRRRAGPCRLLMPNLFGTPIAIFPQPYGGLHRKQANHSYSSLCGEKRDPLSRSVPSLPSSAPDFRDRAGFEWSSRQPSRREMQCVPN